MLQINGNFWTSRELAQEAGLDQSRIRHLLLDGTIQGLKFSNRWLIPDEEAKKWLASRSKSQGGESDLLHSDS